MVDKLEQVAIKWKCHYCKYIIKEPYQLTECGHRVCKGCFESRAAMAIDDIMTCPAEDCAFAFQKTQFMIDRAFKRELDPLQVTCLHKTDVNCMWSGPLKAYQEHLDETHIHYSCDLCGEQFPSCQVLTDHTATKCSFLFRTCPLAPYCGEAMIRKDAFPAHLLSEKHQEAMCLIITDKYDVEKSIDQDHDMESSSVNIELEQQVSEKLSTLADKVQKLNDDTVQISRDFIKLNELRQVTGQEINNFQSAIVDRNVIMNTLQSKQQSVQKEIEQLQQKLEDNKYVSEDGTLTWRVDRVAERMSDAQSDRQPSIFSPIFFSTPTGYKMRARLYLHGDGNARRTHISLFFLLLKGEHDALLSWPFGHKVTFCLFDQTGNNRHIIDSFRPDTKSNSFLRPTTEANIASGIPKFFPLTMIQQDDSAYVRDDTLFLKIIVDLDDTPKMILPFMLTLNPGLPAHVQQHLVKKEKANRQSAALSNEPTTIPLVSGN